MAKFVNQSKDLLGNVLDKTETSLSKMLDNPYVSVSLKVFLGLYAAFAAPQLPKNLALLLDSTLVRVIFAALIVYTSLRDPVTAILIAIVFVVTLQTAARYRLYDTSESVLAPGGISWLPSAKQGAVVEEKAKIGEKVLGGLKVLGGSAVGGATNVGGAVVGGAREIGTGILGGAQQLGSGVAGGVRQLGSGVVGSAQHLGSGVVGGVREIGGGLVSGVQHVGGGVARGLTGLGGCLMDSAQEIGGGLVTGTQALGSSLITGAQHIGGGLVGGVQELGGGVVGSVQELGGSVVGGVQQLGTGVLGGAQQLSTGVVRGVKSLAQPIGFEHMSNMEPAPASSCPYAPFTNAEQLDNAESNFVPGADQGSCVQTFKNQLCIQGLQSNTVQGY